MNPLASINKSIRELEASWPKCKTEESRGKARDAIAAACNRMGLGFFEMVVPDGVAGVPAPSVVMSVPDVFPGTLGEELPGGGVVVTPEVGRPVELKETGSVEVYNGNPVLPPVSDHEWEGSASHSVTVAEQVKHESPVLAPHPVDIIGGWPERSQIEIYGLAPNRRHLRGKLDDGRVVTVERTFGRVWTNGEKVACRLIRAGGAPLFRVCA